VGMRAGVIGPSLPPSTRQQHHVGKNELDDGR
jgi:hypothetical protein